MDYDIERVRSILFDPQISLALAEMETGPKPLARLAEASGIGEGDLAGHLDYMVTHGFLSRAGDSYSANAEKLDALLSDERHFDSVMDGLTEMDSYLN